MSPNVLSRRVPASGRILASFAALFLLLGISGCRQGAGGGVSKQPSGPPIVAVFLGDSITAGYRIGTAAAFPALLEAEFHEQGRAVRFLNAGVPGDTTTSALERLGPLLDLEPDLVVVELGANDTLRSVPRSTTFKNLVSIVDQCRDAGARVILTGTRFVYTHPAYERYVTRMYERVAEETGVALLPDLLVGVSGIPRMSLPDGLHPSRAGHKAIAATLEPVLSGELDEIAKHKQG